MRLFFAIMLPESVQRRLGRYRSHLAWLPGRPNWTATPNLHITLKFLGEVGDPLAAALASQTSHAVQCVGPLSLRPDHLVFFPPDHAIRVLGVGFTGDVSAISSLQASIELFCATQGFVREDRPYTPHATLARFKQALRPQCRPRIIECCKGLERESAFEVSEFQLMQSQPGPAGSTYIRLATFSI